MKKTVGQIATELWNNSEKPIPVKDLTDELLTDYEKNVIECIHTGFKKHINDFFVVVLTKRERLLTNVIRNFFISRITCPIPNYDQIVYKYTRKNQSIKLLWVIPSREASWWYKDNALIIPKEEKQILNWVLDFDALVLDKKCNQMNKEIYLKRSKQ